MGQLINGDWKTEKLVNLGKDGKFVRKDSGFRNWITPDGSAGPSGDSGFAAESGRYHLYVSLACPWAHRTLIFRALKGLEDHITVDVVHPDMLENGWTFQTDDGPAQGDSLFNSKFLYQIYQKADLDATTRVTVPVLWDKQKNCIVSNESAEIIRMLNSAFDGITGNTQDFWPTDLREGIEEVNARIYTTLNNGVYKAGFASSQSAYDSAITPLFETIDWLEDHLSTHRYLMGDRLTEADWRLFTTLVRFDAVYHTHFKCNRNRITDMPNLWAYSRELFQWPGVERTVHFGHIVRHYHYSQDNVNPHRIIPINPSPDWHKAHKRGT